MCGVHQDAGNTLGASLFHRMAKLHTKARVRARVRVRLIGYVDKQLADSKLLAQGFAFRMLQFSVPFSSVN